MSNMTARKCRISPTRRLTFALSGAPPQKQAKDAPLFGASALERGVRWHIVHREDAYRVSSFYHYTPGMSGSRLHSETSGRPTSAGTNSIYGTPTDMKIVPAFT